MKAIIDIVIVNWNSGEQLRQCLASIEAADRGNFTLLRVCVVDNGSQDNSLNGIGQYELPIQIIRNGQNRGFAAACNQGARGSQTDYILFLNPDVRLFKDSLTIPIAFMEKPESKKKVGIVGIQLLDDTGNVASTCARFPTPGRFFANMLGLDRLFPRRFPSLFMVEWDHRESREVDHVIGAFFLVRRSLFEVLGGFDERFFVYWEDLDFSLRAKRAGWCSFYLAEAQAYHKGGGISEQIKAARLFYSLRSRILYGYKHFSWWAATGLAVGTLFLEPFTRLVWATVRGSLKENVDTIRGYLMLWKETPRLIKLVWEQMRHEHSTAKPL